MRTMNENFKGYELLKKKNYVRLLESNKCGQIYEKYYLTFKEFN